MRVVDKPWGREEIWAENHRYVGKFLYIDPSAKLSRQYHEVKDETIYVLEGLLELEIGVPDTEEYVVLELAEGEHYHVLPKTVHRFCAPEWGHVKLVEVSTSELEDVVRLEDMYDRGKE